MSIANFLEVRGGKFYPRTDQPLQKELHDKLIDFFSNFNWKHVADLSIEGGNAPDKGGLVRVGPWIRYNVQESGAFSKDGIRHIEDSDFLFYYFVPVLESHIHRYKLSSSLKRGSSADEYYEMQELEETGISKIPEADMNDICVRYESKVTGPWPGCGPYMEQAKTVGYVPNHLIYDLLFQR
jgi:hypothetical protein